MRQNSRGLWLQVMAMQRSDIVRILTDAAIVCQDTDTNLDLAQELFQSILDGTISQDALSAFDERSTT